MKVEAVPLDVSVEEPDLRIGRDLRRLIEREFACLGDATADAALVISELFTNAVLHGALPVRVWAIPVEGGVRLRVEDAAPRFGDPRDDSQGLVLVGALGFGAWRHYSQQREVMATSEQRRNFVPSVRVATVRASDRTSSKLP